MAHQEYPLVPEDKFHDLLMCVGEAEEGLKKVKKFLSKLKASDSDEFESWKKERLLVLNQQIDNVLSELTSIEDNLGDIYTG